MFGIFKRKPKIIPPEWQAVADRHLGPVAMATALADVVGDHARRIAAREVAYPAHKEAGAPVIRIWHSLRLESCIGAVRFGEGSLFDLADIGTQGQVLDSFIENRAHLMFPQPSGSRFDQSVQGMFQAYNYLSQVGTEVCDELTDRYRLGVQKKDILTDLEEGAKALHQEWKDSLSGAKPSLPGTLFDLFFADLNAKTKSIAFSAFFGPEPDKAIPEFLEKVREVRGAEFAAEYQAELAIIRASANPDEAAEQLDAR